MEYTEAVMKLLNAVIDQAIADLDIREYYHPYYRRARYSAQKWLIEDGIGWAYMLGWTEEDIQGIRDKLNLMCYNEIV